MPDQASLGAGVLQTAMRLSISLGLAITAAVYGSTSQSSSGISDATFPYERAFLCTIIFSVIGILFVPFMRIGRHGSKAESEKDEMLQDRPATGGQYSERASGQYDGRQSSQEEHQIGIDCGNSSLTINTMATTGSQASYFPRWSWEDERELRDNKHTEPNVVYEVCIKCLEERKVVVEGNEAHSGGQLLLPNERRHSRRHSRQEADAVETGWTRLPDERLPTRHQYEDRDEVLTQLADERIRPRRQVERSWQRFPVRPTRRDVEGADVHRDDGWL